MQEEKTRRTQSQRRAETRTALLAAARRLIIAKGYAETSTPEIVRAAEVTRGALYHHFADKAAVMEALVRQEAEAVAAAISQAALADLPPLEAFMAGARAYFSAMAVPGRVEILLQEGPAVLGPDVMAAIDQDTGTATLVEGLQAVAADGRLSDAEIEPLADLLAAAFDRAAFAIAQGEDREAYEAAIRLLLRGVIVR
ncbi:MAG: helix-turn-helix domain-containing protein [Rhodospirillaceae bacterium]